MTDWPNSLAVYDYCTQWALGSTPSQLVFLLKLIYAQTGNSCLKYVMFSVPITQQKILAQGHYSIKFIF